MSDRSSYVVLPDEIDPDLQVEIDGLRLGVCLAIAKRLERYPDFRMPGLRVSLTDAQRSAVEQYRSGQR